MRLKIAEWHCACSKLIIHSIWLMSNHGNLIWPVSSTVDLFYPIKHGGFSHILNGAGTKPNALPADKPLLLSNESFSLADRIVFYHTMDGKSIGISLFGFKKVVCTSLKAIASDIRSNVVFLVFSFHTEQIQKRIPFVCRLATNRGYDLRTIWGTDCISREIEFHVCYFIFAADVGQCRFVLAFLRHLHVMLGSTR